MQTNKGLEDILGNMTMNLFLTTPGKANFFICASIVLGKFNCDHYLKFFFHIFPSLTAN